LPARAGGGLSRPRLPARGRARRHRGVRPRQPEAHAGMGFRDGARFSGRGMEARAAGGGLSLDHRQRRDHLRGRGLHRRNTRPAPAQPADRGGGFRECSRIIPLGGAARGARLEQQKNGRLVTMNALSPEALGFDPDALREKYREERDRRLRTDGNEQYVEVKGDFRHYVDDPYVPPPPPREPKTDEVEILVIGGGFGGQIAAARLREAGFEDIRIVEKGGDFGGTWYWNRYPGAQCDIEAYIYLPLLEETGYVPKEKYSFAPEIREHAQRIGKHYDLYRDVLFQTEIEDIRWLDDESKWLIHTNRGDAFRARFVVMSNGPLNRPKLPGIPGIDSFKGHTFHTSRWDYGYTGGDTTGKLHKLGDKRVAIIGTGATAIQCVPHLGRHAKHLYVFQRTPSSVDVRGNKRTDPEWVKTLTP